MPSGKKLAYALRRFEFTDSRSNKYWEVWVDGCVTTTHWGKIGTAGSYQPKSFGNTTLAISHAIKMVKEKLAKGYREVSVTSQVPNTINVPTTVAYQPPETVPQNTVEQNNGLADEKQKRAFSM